MARLSAQSIRELCQPGRPMMLSPFQEEKLVVNGKSGGLSSASYDCHLNHDLVLGPHPGHVFRNYLLDQTEDFIIDSPGLVLASLQRVFKSTPLDYSLGYTVEKFHMPNTVSADVADKSTYARLFVSCYNTFIDPGFIGDLTLEIINLSKETVEIKAGDPVCQLIFTWMDKETEIPYRGKYQHQKGATPPIMEKSK